MSWSGFASAGAGVADPRTQPFLEWGVASRPFGGGPTSGDVAVVRVVRDVALVAACDGLGHGVAAARAATAAAAVLDAFSGEDAVALARRCDEALRSTRGAALSLAVFSAPVATLTWVGVGNVEGRLLRGNSSAPGAAVCLMPDVGIVGNGVAPTHPVTLPVERGDTLILATDGVAGRFADSVALVGTPQDIAGRILDEHGRPTDDALVLVARYLGSRS